eukprot:12072973-Ditylum_brightwellii.AAC.1
MLAGVRAIASGQCFGCFSRGALSRRSIQSMLRNASPKESPAQFMIASQRRVRWHVSNRKRKYSTSL